MHAYNLLLNYNFEERTIEPYRKIYSNTHTGRERFYAQVKNYYNPTIIKWIYFN